jgi:protein arginine kinase activator
MDQSTVPPADPRCPACGRNPGKVKVNDVDKNGRARELLLCTECARKRGVLAPDKSKASVSEVIQELKDKPGAGDALLVCPRCRLTYADFRRTLRLGCEQCYEAFADNLNTLLRRVHGATRHAGRVPKPDANAAAEYERRRLERELKRAVAAEDYERAASVRDRIRQTGNGTTDGNEA